MHFLTEKIKFPDVSEASIDGLLAIGGDLSSERLLQAYSSGIFPWFEDNEKSTI
jgi:leucyl/phenylalanyl-tRNA--protein transferase